MSSHRPALSTLLFICLLLVSACRQQGSEFEASTWITLAPDTSLELADLEEVLASYEMAGPGKASLQRPEIRPGPDKLDFEIVARAPSESEARNLSLNAARFISATFEQREIEETRRRIQSLRAEERQQRRLIEEKRAALENLAESHGLKFEAKLKDEPDPKAGQKQP